MTARGWEFLEAWVRENAPTLPVTGDVLVRALAQKLKDDASGAGLALADLEIDGPQVEAFIREMMAHVAERGTTGD